MRKTILFILTAILIVSSMTACGSKDNKDVDKATESRVLYSDDVSSEEESDEEESEAEKNSESVESEEKDDTDTAKAESTVSTEKSSDTSSKAASSGNTSSKSVSSQKSVSAASSNSSKKSVTTTSSAAPKTVVTTSVPTQNNTATTITHGDNVSQNNTSVTGSESSETQSEQSSEQPDTGTDLATDTESDVVGSFDESDLVITLEGGSINFGDDIESVKAILGEPLDTQEAPSCKYTGQLDKTFIFSDCSINTYPNEDGSKDYVVGIVITSGDYTTSKGAKIGTSSDELIKLYGNSVSDDSPMRKYTIGDKTLSFYVEGDAVAEINYIWDN